jgi:hypothetical protein
MEIHGIMTQSAAKLPQDGLMYIDLLELEPSAVLVLRHDGNGTLVHVS